jgi:hypothetical protein
MLEHGRGRGELLVGKYLVVDGFSGKRSCGKGEDRGKLHVGQLRNLGVES